MSERGLNDLGASLDNLPSISEEGAKNNLSTPPHANASESSFELVENTLNTSNIDETSVLGSTAQTNQEDTVVESPRETFAQSAELDESLMSSQGLHDVEPPAVAAGVNPNRAPVPPLEVNPVQSFNADIVSNKMDGGKVLKKEASSYIHPLTAFETPQKKGDSDKLTTSQQQLDFNKNYVAMSPITDDGVIRIEFMITDNSDVNQLSAQACQDGFRRPKSPGKMATYLVSITDGIKAILLKIRFLLRVSHAGLLIFEISESDLRIRFPVGDLTVALTQYLRDPNATLTRINVEVLPKFVDYSRAIQWIDYVLTHQASLAFPLPRFPIETGSGITPLLITRSTRLY